MIQPSELDTRPPARGAGRVVVLVYGFFALATTARAVWQLLRDASEAPVAYGLSAFAAVVYLLATIVLAHNGRRARKVAWVAVSVELVGVIIVGTISLLYPEHFPRSTVWSVFGIGYGFVPLVLPVLGMLWLWRSSPARIQAESGRP